MDEDKLTIERVITGGENGMTLYRLSNGDIVNEDEAVNYVRQGRLENVVVAKNDEGGHYIKPAGSPGGTLR